MLAAVGGPAAIGDDGIGWSDRSLLEELRALAVSAGAEIVGEVYQRRDAADKTYFIGKGKAEELRDEVKMTGADLVVFDNDLSPAQGKNLEDLIGVRVLDRSRAHPRHLRRPGAHARGASCRSSWPSSSTCSRASSACGRTSRGSAAASVCADRARRSSRPTGALIRDADRDAQGEARAHRGAARLQRKGARSTRCERRARRLHQRRASRRIMNRLSGERLHAEDRLFATLDADHAPDRGSRTARRSS